MVPGVAAYRSQWLRFRFAVSPVVTRSHFSGGPATTRTMS